MGLVGATAPNNEEDARDLLTNKFSKALEEIWDDLEDTISKGALVVPDSLSDRSPLEDINRRIERNRREQKFLSQTFGDAFEQHLERMERAERGGSLDKAEAGNNGDSMYSSAELEDNGQSSGGWWRWGKKRVQPLEAVKTVTRSIQSWYDQALQQAQAQGRFGDKFVDKIFIAEILLHKALSYLLCCSRYGEELMDAHDFDDGVSYLSAEEYVRKRLLPVIAEYTVRAPSTACRSNFVTGTTIFLSVLSSVMSTFGLVCWIPVTLALASALSAWSSYNRFELRLSKDNSALPQLHQIVIWCVAPCVVVCVVAFSASDPLPFSFPPSSPQVGLAVPHQEANQGNEALVGHNDRDDRPGELDQL